MPDVREARREKQSKKAPPDMSQSRRARRQQGTNPGQKRRTSALSRGERPPACMPEREREKKSSEHVKRRTREAHVAGCTHEAISARETRRQRHEDRRPPSDAGRPNESRRGADHTVVLETTGELQWYSISPTRQRGRRRSLICYCCPESEAAMKTLTL